MTGFAALDLETQQQDWPRQLGGYIPADFYCKVNDPFWLSSEGAWLPIVGDLMQSGIYQNDCRLLFQTMGHLAALGPAQSSKLVPGLVDPRFNTVADNLGWLQQCNNGARIPSTKTTR